MPEPLALLGDSPQLSEVLINFVGTVIKFSEHGESADRDLVILRRSETLNAMHTQQSR